MRTILTIEAEWGGSHRWQSVVIPEPYQAGEPEDICIWTGIGQRWAVKRRHAFAPFELPSPHYAPVIRGNLETTRPW